jgi:hypothetical protein
MLSYKQGKEKVMHARAVVGNSRDVFSDMLNNTAVSEALA